MAKGQRLSTVQQKKDFLRAHPELWTQKASKIRDAIAEAGLCAKTTYPMDLRLNKTLAELREEIVVKAAEEAAKRAVRSIGVILDK